MRRISIIGAAVAMMMSLLFWTFWRADSSMSAAHRLASKADDAIVVPPPAATELSRLVAAFWTGGVASFADTASDFWESPNLGVYAAARRDGERLGDLWDVDAGRVRDALERVVGSLGRNAPESTTLELFIVTDRRYHDPASSLERASVLANEQRGVRGFAMQWGRTVRLYSPTQMLADNRSAQQQLVQALHDAHVSTPDFESGGHLYSLGGPQYLISLRNGSALTSVQMFRGNTLVPLNTVDSESTRALAERASNWTLRALHKDGRFTYLYKPSEGRESDSNNMIRQWMASLALIRIAARHNDPVLWERVTRNIDYNLAHFYREESIAGTSLGLIESDKDAKVKLGAVGLAALAISEHPQRERWREQYLALNRTVEFLWHEDGRFDTFYKKPPTTRDQPNFYPGEALLMWADRYAREPDPTLLHRIMASFRYYRDWHLNPANRNPAFVPWHVRAYAKLWRETRDPALLDFIFEMSDWLLTMQEWTPEYPDSLGQFYDPARPKFGPPHASATGVYLEGYIEAFQLARAVGDHRRAENYRRAIVGGLRSLMQLQFVDDVDMYYVRDRSLVEGGIRSTVYNNEIRCDNVQHGLMAMLEIVDVFGEEDYAVR